MDIRTEKNSDVEGAVIASGTGNLKLDTGTLTYKDISDHDTGSNTQVGVSVPLGSAIGGDTAPAAKNNAQDQPSALKQFLSASTLDTSYDSHDRRQVDRATIGEGTITVRSDPDQDLTTLNRDPNKAQEITRNDKTKADVYVDPAAIKEVASGFQGIRDEVMDLAKSLKVRFSNDERRMANAGYAGMTQEQQEKAQSDFASIRKLYDPANPEGSTKDILKYIAGLSQDERNAIIFEATKDGVSVEMVDIAKKALLGPYYLETTQATPTEIHGYQAETEKFLTQQELAEVDAVKDTMSQYMSAHQEAVHDVLFEYRYGDKKAAIQRMVSLEAEMMGFGLMTVKFGPNVDGNTAQVAPYFNGSNFRDIRVVEVDSEKFSGTSAENAFATIAHELFHKYQDNVIVEAYLKGDHNNSGGALLANSLIYLTGKVDGGAYYAQVSEAQAWALEQKILKALTKI